MSDSSKNYTLKGIPPDLYEMTKRAAKDNFRSFNQELLARLQLSHEVEMAAVSRLHAQWIEEARASGPPSAKERWADVRKQFLSRRRSRRLRP